MDEPVLDLKGLKCPLPVLKTRKALTALSPGTRLTVLTTDPMAAIDIPHFCNEARHTLVSAETSDGSGTFVIEKGAS
ncbi:MAG: sulfurtransferase TusA family protein [Roseibium sp.]|nr:sulfurtransferase TusA family protein [Roseibium sp.]